MTSPENGVHGLMGVLAFCCCAFECPAMFDSMIPSGSRVLINRWVRGRVVQRLSAGGARVAGRLSPAQKSGRFGSEGIAYLNSVDDGDQHGVAVVVRSRINIHPNRSIH